MSHTRIGVHRDDNQAIRAGAHARAAIPRLSQGPLHHGLRDVTILEDTLRGMGYQDRRKYIAADRLERMLSRSTLCEQSQPQPAVDFTGLWHAYRDRWNIPALGLRELYNHNTRAYVRAFWSKQEVLDTILECGMKAFTMITQRLEKTTQKTTLQKDQTRSYLAVGRLALDAVGHVLAGTSSRTTSHDANVVLVSIDFEGGYKSRGINGFGATTFDSRLVNPPDCSILQTRHFRCRSKSNNNFLFGHTTRIDGDAIKKIVIDAVRTRTNAEQRRIVLVGHGLLISEVTLLKTLGITFEDLHVVGLLDTLALAREILGIQGSLESLLQYFQIDYTRSSLHCAGSDAYYTMQVLLALLERSHFATHPNSPRGDFTNVIDVVTRPIPKLHRRPRRIEGGSEEQEEESNGKCREDHGTLQSGDLGALFA